MCILIHPKNKLLHLLLISFFLEGCLGIVPPPASTLDLSLLDTSPVKGKIIVIDPGHGEPELGAIGFKGLRESETNLGVALCLWGLLKNAGAIPILTRTTNRCVLADNEFLLKQDLQARSDISNKYKADLFISIHHNSAIKNRGRNDLIVFYKMTDSGASRDIAGEINKSLNNKLQPQSAAIRPGNYHVLRKTEAPAVLGEASFMSNKKNEALLSFHRTLALEAEGYFTGIINYYKKGVPEITFSCLDNATATPEITAHILPGSLDTSISTSSIKLSLDGCTAASFSFQKDNNQLYFVPRDPLLNGIHRLCLSAKNLSGNVSKKCFSFKISLPPKQLKLRSLFPVIPADGMSVTPVDIEVLDHLNRPVIDGEMVSLSTTGGMLLNTSVSAKKGRARAVLISGEKQQEVTVVAKSGNASSFCRVKFGVPKEALFMATIREPSGRPVEKVNLIRNNRMVGSSDLNGFVYDSVDDINKVSYMLTKKGYKSLMFSSPVSRGRMTVENMVLQPVDKGVFFNRIIILDPAGSSLQTLPMIFELKKMIENAGGTAVLTWETPPAPSNRQRVISIGKEKADIFLTVEIAANKILAGYYFKSQKGKSYAETLSSNLKKNKLFANKKSGIVTSTRYVTIHTAMPAVWLCLPSSSVSTPKQAARNIYEAFAVLFSNEGNDFQTE